MHGRTSFPLPSLSINQLMPTHHPNHHCLTVDILRDVFLCSFTPFLFIHVMATNKRTNERCTECRINSLRMQPKIISPSSTFPVRRSHASVRRHRSRCSPSWKISHRS